MKPLQADVVIDAPRYVVWDALADIEAVVQWNPGIDDVECISEVRSGVGARRRCYTHPTGWMTESITEWFEGELIAFDIEDAAPLEIGVARFDLCDVGSGTRLRASFEYDVKLGPLGPVIDRLIVHNRLGDAFNRGIEGLREFTEAHWRREGIGSAARA
ncbi:MAG: SRPBCC family protein [Actinomycetota bacterium]